MMYGCNTLATLFALLSVAFATVASVSAAVSKGSGGYDPYDPFPQTTPNPPKFDCPSIKPPAHAARNVREVKPGHVGVVMALGDSITAGFGTMGKYKPTRRNPTGKNMNEYRGQSWCIGGDKGEMTFPNFLKHYSPNLVGYSTGHHTAEVDYLIFKSNQHKYPIRDSLNAAQSGAMSYALPTDEVPYLKKRFAEMTKRDPQLQDAWKVVHVLIGANDLCIACLDISKAITAARVYKKRLNQTIADLHESFPNTIVAITEIFKVSQIVDISAKKEECIEIHANFTAECQCAFSPKNGKEKREAMDHIGDKYNEAIREIAHFWNKKRLDGFGIAVLPSFMNADLAKENVDFISSVDCFHPSRLAHSYMALHTFNNLLRPAHKRTSDFNLAEKFVCPTEESVFHVDQY
eukprot:Nk52_evm2s2587 gene=Nk52_evmTU2s2587